MSTEIQTTDQVTNTQLVGYLDAMGLSAKLTDKEKTQFLEISKAFGLNPFKREIYCSKYGTGEYAVMSIIVGYETYIKRAERSGQLDGWNVVTDGTVADNTLKATITIHRKDRKFPFVHEVYYSEYVQKKKDGSVNSFWQKAFTMTKKVAIAQGFRLCFSDEIGGMPYTSDEMPEVTQDVPHEEVKEEEVHIAISELTDEQKENATRLLKAESVEELGDIYKSLSKEEQSRTKILTKQLKTKLTK